jgi:hypothetical protein
MGDNLVEKGEMDRKVVTGITLAMLFMGMLPLAFKVQPVAAPATVDWWPMFHHDLSHNGYSTSTAPKTNQTLWTYTTGWSVVSCPAVVNGVVYVGSADNSTYALNATTGALVWKYKTGDIVWSSPAVVNGVIYVGSADDNVYALNATTGAPVWKYKTGGVVDSSPAVANGVVYVGSIDYKVYAFGAPSTARIVTSVDGKSAIIESNATITNALITKNTLSFYMSGPNPLAHTGWINVTFPMVNTTQITVFIDGNQLTSPPFPIITTNSTHYFIYFEFTLSTHEITIEFAPAAVGGIWVPVDKLVLLAPYIVLTSTILAATAATSLYAKRRKKQE